uniref:Tetratricopeptide repeat protein n=1 Tax=viral metagenome TaxID=1070528 RepID=A0A6C0AWE3_9ZZZZ|tara:strand:- start:5686 stop:5988 length:303 start_codon:yes stop_codon:yes gene_type:complete
MTKHNTKLSVSNLDSFLGQNSKSMSDNTKSKIKFRGANFLMRLGGVKNLRRALKLFDEAYDLTAETYGTTHTRTYNIVNFIVVCESKLDRTIKAIKQSKN